MGCGGSKAAQVSLITVKQIEDRPSGQDEPDPWAYAKVRFKRKSLRMFMKAIFDYKKINYLDILSIARSQLL